MKRFALVALLCMASVGILRAERSSIDWDHINVTTVTFSSASFLCESEPALVWGYIVGTNTLSTDFLMFRDTSTVLARPETSGGKGGDYLTTNETFRVHFATAVTEFPNTGANGIFGTTVRFFPTPVPFFDGVVAKFSVNTIPIAAILTEKRGLR